MQSDATDESTAGNVLQASTRATEMIHGDNVPMKLWKRLHGRHFQGLVDKATWQENPKFLKY